MTRRLPQSRPRRPALERLEDRLAPAVSLSVHDEASVIGTDASGNVFVRGSAAQFADVDPGPGTTLQSGHYLAKYAPDSQLLWVHPFDPGSGVYEAAARESAGQTFLYVVGGDPGGQWWLRRIEDTPFGPNELWGRAIPSFAELAIGSDGAAYIGGGGLSGTFDFDPTDPAGPDDTRTAVSGYVAKWDAGGVFQWVRDLGGAGTYQDVRVVEVVSVGGADLVCMGGECGNLAPELGTPLTNQGSLSSEDGYLVRYDAAGNFVSVGQFADAWLQAVASDGSSTYLAFVHYYDALSFLGHRQDNILLGKLNPTGTGLEWVVQAVGEGDGGGTGTGVDLAVQSGSLFLTGTFGGNGKSVHFGPGPLATDKFPVGGNDTNTVPGYDGFIASYSAAGGSLEWVRPVSINQYSSFNYGATSLVVRGSDLYVGTSVRSRGVLNFGTSVTFANHLGHNGVLLKMTTANVPTWGFSVGSVAPSIDDGGTGYSEIGTGWQNYAIVGYAGDARSHAKGNGSKKAQWAFAGLPAGQYQVFTAWKPSSKNANNAVFKVNGVASAPINQKVAPDDYTGGGWPLESLGTVTVGPSGAVTVELSDAANSTVVADSVFLYLLDPADPLLAVGGIGPAGRTAAGVSRQQLQPLVAEAARRWRDAGADAASLRGIEVRLADLPGATLGLASGNTIWIDQDAAGWGWFVDRTPRSDSEFTTPGDQGEQGRMDLLTVLMHEMGHALGRGHDDHGVMGESLAAGVREGPSFNPGAPVLALDRLFSQRPDTSVATLLHALEQNRRPR